MVYRDPETGQYVSDDGTMPARYDDYEFQHIHSRYTVPADELPGAFPLTETDITATNLDDVLDRHERAELVTLQVHSLQASVPGTSSAESALGARFELRAGVGDELIQTDDRTTTANAGESGVVTAENWDSDSPDALYFASWVAEGGFADSTNGLGGGPDQTVLSETVHYPREFGACPEFDDRDDITESFRLADLGGADISDSLIVLDVSYTLVFAVHEDR